MTKKMTSRVSDSSATPSSRYVLTLEVVDALACLVFRSVGVMNANLTFIVHNDAIYIYDDIKGGAADEGFMIQILSTISPPFSAEQIKSQAFWAATQAVLLIREHKVKL